MKVDSKDRLGTAVCHIRQRVLEAGKRTFAAVCTKVCHAGEDAVRVLTSDA